MFLHILVFFFFKLGFLSTFYFFLGFCKANPVPQRSSRKLSDAESRELDEGFPRDPNAFSPVARKTMKNKGFHLQKTLFFRYQKPRFLMVLGAPGRRFLDPLGL